MYSSSLCYPLERDQEGGEVPIELQGDPVGGAGANFYWHSLGLQWIFGSKPQ